MALRVVSTLIVLLFLAACSSADRGPPPVRDANKNTGGTVRVQSGDSAWSIAKAAGVPLRDLIAANDLTPPYRLTPGQRLYIPNLRLHRVQQGESISVIAERYDVGRFELARLNGIKPPYRVFPRQVLKIPGAGGSNTSTSEVRTVSATPPSPPRREGSRVPAPAKRVAKRPSQQTRKTQPRRTVQVSGMKWPVSGRVISRFGPKQGGLHNDGVNIAAPAGAPVRAASGGKVVYAGNEIRGFGNLVLIRHPNGLTTAYAHLDQTMVKRGQQVSKGATIATVGTSGGVSSPQLHFEIRKGRKALDPVRALGAPPSA